MQNDFEKNISLKDGQNTIYFKIKANIYLDINYKNILNCPDFILNVLIHFIFKNFIIVIKLRLGHRFIFFYYKWYSFHYVL